MSNRFLHRGYEPCIRLSMIRSSLSDPSSDGSEKQPANLYSLGVVRFQFLLVRSDLAENLWRL